MRSVLALCATFVCLPVALAQVEADTSSESPPEEILVTGEFPGPGMWKVTRANDLDQHVLWILGSPPPLPKKMKWKSADVERVVIASQEVLLPVSVSAQPDEKIGFFKAVSLMPAALGARKNPDKGTLQDVVLPEQYQRWLGLKKRFLGKDSAVERWRPIFAANKLSEEAYDDLQLRASGLVWDTLSKTVEKHKIKTTTLTYEFKFSSKDIRAKLKEFAREPLADQECFATTLSLVEALADDHTMHARSAAWATGDLETLLGLAPLPNPSIACITAVMASQVAHDVVPSDIFDQVQQLWLVAAERALATNQSTFAFMSLRDLTLPDGQLAALRAKGYLVEEPGRD